MLGKIVDDFIKYCKTCNFSTRSQEVFKSRLKEFNKFLKNQRLKSILEIKYSHLTQIVMYDNPSVHVKI